MLSSSVTNAQPVPTVSTFENSNNIKKPATLLRKRVSFPEEQFKILDPERNNVVDPKIKEETNNLNENEKVLDSNNKKLNNNKNFDEVENPYHLVSLSPTSYRNDTNKNKIAYVLTILLMCAIFIGLCWVCQKLLFGPEKKNSKKIMKGGGNVEGVISESSTINQNIDQILNSF